MSSRKKPVRTKRRAHVQQYSTGEAPPAPVVALSAAPGPALGSAGENPLFTAKAGAGLPATQQTHMVSANTSHTHQHPANLLLNPPEPLGRSGAHHIEHSAANVDSMAGQSGTRGHSLAGDASRTPGYPLAAQSHHDSNDTPAHHKTRGAQPQQPEQAKWEDNWDEDEDWNAEEQWEGEHAEPEQKQEERWDEDWDKREEWNNEEEWQDDGWEADAQQDTELHNHHHQSASQIPQEIDHYSHNQASEQEAVQTSTENASHGSNHVPELSNLEEYDQEQFDNDNQYYQEYNDGQVHEQNYSEGYEQSDYLQPDQEQGLTPANGDDLEDQNEYFQQEETDHEAYAQEHDHDLEDDFSNYNAQSSLAQEPANDLQDEAFHYESNSQAGNHEQWDEQTTEQQGSQIADDQAEADRDYTHHTEEDYDFSNELHQRAGQEAEQWDPEAQDEAPWGQYENDDVDENPYDHRVDAQDQQAQWEYKEDWNQVEQDPVAEPDFESKSLDDATPQYDEDRGLNIKGDLSYQSDIPEQPAQGFQFPRSSESLADNQEEVDVRYREEAQQSSAPNAQEEAEISEDKGMDSYDQEEPLEFEAKEQEFPWGSDLQENNDPEWARNTEESGEQQLENEDNYAQKESFEFDNQEPVPEASESKPLPWELDDHEDLVVYHRKQEMETHKEAAPLSEAHSQDQQTSEKAATAELKLAALELLDLDDDLLLDDDFLDDDTENLEPDSYDAGQLNEQSIDAWNEQANLHQILPSATEDKVYSQPAQTVQKSQKYQPANPVPRQSQAVAQQQPQQPQQPQQMQHVLPVKPSQPFLPVQPAQPVQQAPKVTQVAKPKLTNSKYASKYAKTTELPVKPQSHGPVQPAPFGQVNTQKEIPTAKKADEELKKKLDAAKKKNDAYDFPLALSQPPVKPASRIPSKQAVPKVPQVPHKETSSTGSVGTPTGSKVEDQRSSNSSSRSFFEELPDTVPKPSHRPVRAAAAAAVPVPATQPAFQEPPAPSAPPISKKKSPMNPYAQLAPKAKVSPMLNKPQMGTVPMSAPLGNAPMGNIPLAPANHSSPSNSFGNLAPAPNKYQPSHGPPPSGMHAPPIGGQVQPPGMVPPPGVIAPQQNNLNQNVLGNNYGQASQVPPQQRNFQSPASQPGFAPPQSALSPAPPHAFAPPQGPQSGYAPPQGPQSGYAPPQGFAPPHGTQPGFVPPQGPQPGFAPAQGIQPGFAPPQQVVPFPSMNQGKSDNLATSPPRVNTNLSKSTEKSSLSPYIPHSGPYAPSAANRGHSRTSSIMGGKGKEVNPYAPAPNVSNVHGPNAHAQGSVPMGVSPSNAAKLPVIRAHGRLFGKQNGAKVGRVSNPAALLERQFPIFNWGNSQSVVHLIPAVASSFGPTRQSLKVSKTLTLLPQLEMYSEFPGPLSKSKSKKKELESWLEKKITKLMSNYSDETLLCQVLLALVQHDGQFTSPALHKDLASILTPNVDFTQEQKPAPNYLHLGSGLSANAYKLDASGVNTVWSLIQSGDREAALSFAISKQDWALSLVVAHSLGPERFSKVASDYARMMFPFQRNQNTKVQHLMPILMKIFAGYSKGPIEDFLNVPSEAEFAKSHYREIISAAIINGTFSEFLVEYGKFLADANLQFASELCFVIGGIIMSKNPLQNGAVFSYVGSLTVTSIYSEIYEYVLLTSPITGNAIPPSGFPHLIPNKIATAQLLADLGAFGTARRYCDHISGILKTVGKSPFVRSNVISDFQNLLMRISESNANDSGWLGSKLSRVNLDKVWGHLDKFIGGEDVTPKPNENGVFSKFSPTISRNTSALDVTQIVNSLPLYRPELQPLNSFISAPPTEFSSPSHPSNRSQIPLRYAPGGPAHKPGSTIAGQPAGHGPAPSNGFARLPHGNLSQTSLADESKQGLTKAPQRKRVGGGNPAQSGIYGNKTAHLSSLSITSQGSQQIPSFTAPPNLGMNPGMKRGSFGSVGSVEHQAQRNNGGEAVHSRMNSKGHSRVSSLHSEASDLSEKDSVRSPEKRPETIREWNEGSNSALRPTLELTQEHSQDNGAKNESIEHEDALAVADLIDSTEIHGSEDVTEEVTEDVTEEITEKAEKNFSEDAPEEAPTETEDKLSEEIADGDKLTPAPATDKTPEEKQPVIEKLDETKHAVKEPTEAAHAHAPPPRGSAPKKANPYAPGASRSVSKGSSKYGPPGGKSANKYAAATSAERSQDVPENVNVNMFDFGTVPSGNIDTNENENLVAEKKEEPMAKTSIEHETPKEEKPVEKIVETEPVQESKDIEAPTVAQEEPVSAPPRRMAPPRKANPYAPTQKLSSANVDISFDYDAPEDSHVESPAAHKPVSLVLNTQNSPGLTAKDRFSNPFQGESKDNGIRIHNGLDEFPIPGSPEYTTRANSVVGNQGLYSSRLSQSHQTDMYQQYEVKDDTVHDYIPVEEDEEDEEEAKARLEAAKRKLEQEKKKKEKEELVSRSGQVSRGSVQSNASGNKWFSGLLKLNDDKPKAIKAKLGQKNTFKYDEKLQRWIDTSRPLEEQLQAATAPPPPKKKVIAKPDGDKQSVAVASEPKTDKAGEEANAAGPTAPVKPGNATEATNADRPAAPARRGRPRPKNAADLANAGLDDLLSLSGSNLGGGPRKGKRRYVNVMDKK